MKAYYETETFNDEYGVLLVQNVYKSDYDSNCIVIKYKRA